MARASMRAEVRTVWVVRCEDCGDEFEREEKEEAESLVRDFAIGPCTVARLRREGVLRAR